MKKLLMALALLPLMAAAVEFSYEFNSDGVNTITLTGVIGEEPAGAFAIPTTYAEKIVTRVGEYAFENNDKITSVLIPGSVKVIARDAFDECRKLQSLTIQEGVESIGEYAFGGCALEAIVIPSSLVDLDSGAFSQNPIREFSVAASNPRYVLSEDGKLLLDKIDERLLHCIANPGVVVIPEGIVMIGHGAFEIAAWTSISFPRTLKCLESGSLDGDKASATELDLKGTSLHRVGPAAFFFSPKLRKIVFPETLRELGVFAFAGCYALNEVFFNGPPPTIVGETDVEVENVLYLIRREGGVIPEGTSVFMSADKQLKNVSILDGVTTYVPRGKGWDDIVATGTWQGRPIRYVSEGPIQETFLPGEAVSIDAGLIGYTAKGLPSGLKYDKKTGKITGAAKKPTAAEGVTVKFTKRNEPDAEIQIVVGPMPTLSISLVGDTEKCKVKGAGAYLVGKKVSLSATAPKGTAFTGWFANGAPWPNEADCRKAKLSYVMTRADVSLVAKFEKERMSVGCAGLEGRGFTVGVSSGAGIPLEIETQSGVKSVKVTKLPAGMKYNAKTGLIEGAPTKAGDFTVQIAVTAKSGAVEKKDIAIRVDPLPDWAVGTFEGAVRQIDYDADGNVVFDGEDLHNWYDIVATVSVDAKGKISGKLTFPDKKTLAVKLNVLTAVEPGICIAEGDVMVKRQRYAVRAVFGAGSFQFADGVVAMGRCDLSIILQGQPTTCFRTDADCPLVQTFWSRKELKGRALQMGLTAKSGFDVENATGEDVEFSGVVKVSDKGVAKLTCTVNGTKSTASGTLLPVGPDVADGFAAYVSIKISRTSFRAVKLLFVPTAEGWVVKAVRW